MPAHPKPINLLPGDELDKAPLGKFLKWALTYGRYIVVITELIVLLAFLSRFKLDRDLSDLSENITRKKNIIKASSQFEEKVRRLQIQLEAVDTIEKEARHIEEDVRMMAQVMPSEAQISSIKINAGNITVNGSTGSEPGLATIMESLRKNPKVKNVTVGKINKDGANGVLSFSLTIDLWL